MSIAKVQYTSDNGGGSSGTTSHTLAMGAPTTAGNLLVAFAVGTTSGANSAITISDDGAGSGNTWAPIYVNNIGTFTYGLWYAENSIPCQTLFLGNSTNVCWTDEWLEFSGIAASGSLDQVVYNTGTSATLDSGTVTTTVGNELWIGGFGAGSGSLTFTMTKPGSPWDQTYGVQLNSAAGSRYNRSFLGNQINVGAGSLRATTSVGISTAKWVGIAASFFSANSSVTDTDASQTTTDSYTLLRPVATGETETTTEASILRIPGTGEGATGSDTRLTLTASSSDTDFEATFDGGEHVSATITGTETGTGTDAYVRTAVNTAADTGTGTDAVSTFNAAPPVGTESGAAADTQNSVTVTAMPGSDTGHGTETGAVSTVRTDTDASAAAVDDGSITSNPVKTDTDTGTGTDAVTSYNATLSDAGGGTGTDVAALGSTATVTDSDIFSGTDVMTSVHATGLTDTDTATGTDTTTTAGAVRNGTDNGTGSDSFSIAAVITDFDAVQGLETGSALTSQSGRVEFPAMPMAFIPPAFHISIPTLFQWNVAALAISGPVSLSDWNTLTTVPINSSVAWETPQRLSVTAHSAWATPKQLRIPATVRYRVVGRFSHAFAASEWVTLKHVSSAINSVAFADYNIVKKPALFQWDTIAREDKRGFSKWNSRVRELVAALVQWNDQPDQMPVTTRVFSKWSVQARKSSTTASGWNTRGQQTVVSSKSCAWNTIKRIDSTKASAWATHKKITKSATCLWDAIYRPAKHGTSLWNTKRALVSDTGSLWNTPKRKNKTATSATWETTKRVSKTGTSCTWETRKRLVKAVPSLWNTRQRPAGLPRIEWDTIKRIHSTASSAWETRKAIVKTSTSLQWNDRHSVVVPSSRAVCAWKVIQRAHKPKAYAFWNTRQRPHSTPVCTWNTAKRKNQTAAFAWDIYYPRVHSTRTILWDMTTHATSTKTCTWNTLKRKSSTNRILWDEEWTTKLVWHYQWQTLKGVTSTATMEWDVGASLQTTIRMVPNNKWSSMT